MGSESVGIGTEEKDEYTEPPIEKSAWQRLCIRYGVNPNLVMLKISLFVMYGGMYTIHNYNNKI